MNKYFSQTRPNFHRIPGRCTIGHALAISDALRCISICCSLALNQDPGQLNEHRRKINALSQGFYMTIGQACRIVSLWKRWHSGRSDCYEWSVKQFLNSTALKKELGV